MEENNLCAALTRSSNRDEKPIRKWSQPQHWRFLASIELFCYRNHPKTVTKKLIASFICSQSLESKSPSPSRSFSLSLAALAFVACDVTLGDCAT